MQIVALICPKIISMQKKRGALFTITTIFILYYLDYFRRKAEYTLPIRLIYTRDNKSS